jgi:rubrerythrin
VGFTAVMDKLLEFELALRDLYQWFSNGFRIDQEAAKTFGRLAIQEEKHANLIRYQKRLWSANSPAIAAMGANLEEVDLLLAEIDTLRRRDNPPTLSEAIELSIRLERSAAEKLHRTVVTDSNPDLGPFISQLAGDDDKHIEMLESLAGNAARKAS